MKPTSLVRLSANEVRFLIESGAFTAEEWAETSASVNRGSLQLSTTEAWLLALFATMSMQDVTGFLGWNESDVTDAVADGRLYAIEISGRLRFPGWQFDVGSPSKLLPGLTQMIGIITPRWDWQSAAGFMATPQRDLVARGARPRFNGSVTEAISTTCVRSSRLPIGREYLMAEPHRRARRSDQGNKRGPQGRLKPLTF